MPQDRHESAIKEALRELGYADADADADADAARSGPAQVPGVPGWLTISGSQAGRTHTINIIPRGSDTGLFNVDVTSSD